jgi:hypothetical protein
MKFTEYFEYTRIRPDRIDIKEEWIAKAFFNPIREEIQSDNRIRRWAKIPEAGDKYLRIVILEDNETVHNAFFDRNFKEKL